MYLCINIIFNPDCGTIEILHGARIFTRRAFLVGFTTDPEFRGEHRFDGIGQPFPGLGHVQPIVEVFVVHRLGIGVVGQTVFDQ